MAAAAVSQLFPSGTFKSFRGNNNDTMAANPSPSARPFASTRQSTQSMPSVQPKRGTAALKNASVGKKIGFGIQLALGAYDPDNVRRSHDQEPHIRPKFNSFSGRSSRQPSGMTSPTQWGPPKSAAPPIPTLTPAMSTNSSRPETPNHSSNPVPTIVTPDPEIKRVYSNKPFAGRRTPKAEAAGAEIPTLDAAIFDESSATRFSKDMIPPPPPRQRASARLASLNNRLEHQIELPPVVEMEEDDEEDEMDRIQNIMGRMNRMQGQDAASKPRPIQIRAVKDEEEIPLEPPPRSPKRKTARPRRSLSLRHQEEVAAKHRPKISAPLDLVSASNKLAFEAPDIEQARAQLAASHKRQISGSSQSSSGEENISDSGMTDTSSVSSVSIMTEVPEMSDFEVTPITADADVTHYFAVRT